jgi:hypothetical protein
MALSGNAAEWAAAIGTVAAAFVGLFGVYWGFHLGGFRPDVKAIIQADRKVAAITVVNRGRMAGVVARVMVMTGVKVRGVELGTSAVIRKDGIAAVELPFPIGPGESALLVVDLADGLPQGGCFWVGFGDRHETTEPKPLEAGSVAEGSMLPPSARARA